VLCLLGMATRTLTLAGNLADVLRGGPLSEEQSLTIYQQGREAVVFALLELSKQLAEQRAAGAGQSHQTPSTPSGMKPPYLKPPGKSRKRPPGAQAGHPGTRRAAPERIDHRREHRADRCPDCGVPAAKRRRQSTRRAAIELPGGLQNCSTRLDKTDTPSDWSSGCDGIRTTCSLFWTNPTFLSTTMRPSGASDRR
jgi:hypothetical protein